MLVVDRCAYRCVDMSSNNVHVVLPAADLVSSLL